MYVFRSELICLSNLVGVTDSNNKTLVYNGIRPFTVGYRSLLFNNSGPWRKVHNWQAHYPIYPRKSFIGCDRWFQTFLFFQHKARKKNAPDEPECIALSSDEVEMSKNFFTFSLTLLHKYLTREAWKQMGDGYLGWVYNSLS